MRTEKKRNEKKSKKKSKKKNQEKWLRDARNVSSLEEIAEVIETMQFHRRFGRIDEQEVWDKLLILDEMYRRVFFIHEQKLMMQMKEKYGAERRI